MFAQPRVGHLGSAQVQQLELGQSFEVCQRRVADRRMLCSPGHGTSVRERYRNDWLARTLLILSDPATQLLDLGNRLRFVRLRFCRPAENRGKQQAQQREQDSVHGIVLSRKWARRKSRQCILAVGPLLGPAASMIIFTASLPAVNQLLRCWGIPRSLQDSHSRPRRQSPGRLRSEGREAGHEPARLGLRCLRMFRQWRAILLS